MIDEEITKQHADITGEQTMTCDVCGIAVAPPAMELVDRAVFSLGVQGDIDYVWLCLDCWRALQEGTLELEIEHI